MRLKKYVEYKQGRTAKEATEIAVREYEEISANRPCVPFEIHVSFASGYVIVKGDGERLRGFEYVE